MRAFVLAASLAILASPVTAFSNPPIAPSQAIKNVGACMTVEGHASMSPDGSQPGIDINLDSQDSSVPFRAYVPYPSGLPDLQSLDGQNVDITGIVLIDRGIPSIQLNNPELIWAAGNEPDKLVTCDND